MLDKDKSRSPEEEALFDLLAVLLDEYEDRILPPPPLQVTSGVEMLKYLMKQNKLKQKDMADIFGGQSVVSDVLKGKREITKYQAKRLSETFKVSAEAFI